MVNKQRYRDLSGEPPAPDESWWDSVLAEDEEHYAAAPAKPAAQKNSNGKTNGVRGIPHAEETVDVVNWDDAIQIYEKDLSVDLEVTGFNRGGLLVCGDELQGFVPVSHLIETPNPDVDVEDMLAEYVGRLLCLKIIECDKERGRVVFSERAALSGPGSRNQLLNRLNPGDCIYGTVTNITDFGVFVDLGGVEGLIHVSEISWGRVHHPADVVSLGQSVHVYVINVERDRARVALSLKRLVPNPWATAEERYHPGMVIDAVVTSIVPFGAFARLEEGLDGLIHISEMGQGEQINPADMLQEGQHVRVRVLHVDGSKQRLGLSLYLNDKI